MTVSLSLMSRVELLYFFLKSREVTLPLSAGSATESILTRMVSAMPRMMSPTWSSRTVQLGLVQELPFEDEGDVPLPFDRHVHGQSDQLIAIVIHILIMEKE